MQIIENPEVYDAIIVGSGAGGGMATKVLADNVKMLADSLDRHWDSFHGTKEDNPSREVIEKLLNALKGADQQVRVPSVRRDLELLKLNPWNPFDKRLKLLKLDFGMLYTKENGYDAYIPDPWILMLRAAINWSAFAYASDEELKNDSLKNPMKLLPGCCAEEKPEFVDMDQGEGFRWPQSYVQKLARKKIQEGRKQEETSIKNTTFQLFPMGTVSSDLSNISDGVAIVSDDDDSIFNFAVSDNSGYDSFCHCER